MELIARIDCDGRCYIGKYGRDDKSVKAGNAKPVTIVRNENHGQNVSLEDIARARARHRKGYNDYTWFAEQDVADFYNKRYPLGMLILAPPWKFF